MALRGEKNDSSSPFLLTETIFSYSMYSESMDCRVCSNNIKGIVMAKERMKGNRGRKEEVAETKALYRFLRGRNRPRKGKTIRKRGKIVGTRNIPSRNQNLPTSPDILGRIFPVVENDGGRGYRPMAISRNSSQRYYCGHWILLESKRKNNSRLQRMIKTNSLIFDREKISFFFFFYCLFNVKIIRLVKYFFLNKILNLISYAILDFVIDFNINSFYVCIIYIISFIIY